MSVKAATAFRADGAAAGGYAAQRPDTIGLKLPSGTTLQSSAVELQRPLSVFFDDENGGDKRSSANNKLDAPMSYP